MTFIRGVPPTYHITPIGEVPVVVLLALREIGGLLLGAEGASELGREDRAAYFRGKAAGLLDGLRDRLGPDAFAGLEPPPVEVIP